MARYSFRLPDIGEGIAEAEIVAWHVKIGERVEEDAQLADMMTDKATVEMSDEIKEKFCKIMEINSPSGVFEDYGKNLDLGLAGGIKDNAGEAVSAVRYMVETVISAAEDALSAADLSLDLGVNAAALDRAANVSASYSVKASDKSESAKTPSPATFQLVAGSRVVAEWLFPDMNDLLGKTTTLQLKGVAT
jgi:2-oxoisovalerate dehydrogenase E2 component (dihydrolipoyl transacylase)